MTPEQRATVVQYQRDCQEVGKAWRTQLSIDWQRSGSRIFSGDWAYLQQLRNQIGPSGLTCWAEAGEVPCRGLCNCIGCEATDPSDDYDGPVPQEWIIED